VCGSLPVVPQFFLDFLGAKPFSTGRCYAHARITREIHVTCDLGGCACAGASRLFLNFFLYFLGAKPFSTGRCYRLPTGDQYYGPFSSGCFGR
jgi:hypothetical protein